MQKSFSDYHSSLGPFNLAEQRSRLSQSFSLKSKLVGLWVLEAHFEDREKYQSLPNYPISLHYSKLTHHAIGFLTIEPRSGLFTSCKSNQTLVMTISLSMM